LKRRERKRNQQINATKKMLLIKIYKIKKKKKKKNQTNKMIQKIYLTKIRSFVCYFHFYSLFSKKTKIFVLKIQNERGKMCFNFRRRLLPVRDGTSKVVKQKNVFTFIWYSHDITWPSRKRDRKNRTQRGMSWDRLFFLSLKPPGVSFLIFVVFPFSCCP
jgi:hypothetical protein